MKVSPLNDYHSPEYPTEEHAKTEPALLRSVPRRWQGNRAVLTALAAALAMTQGCSSSPFARLGGKPLVSHFTTEKEVQPPRHTGPKPALTPKPELPLVLGIPVPSHLTTEAEASAPSPSLSPRPQ